MKPPNWWRRKANQAMVFGSCSAILASDQALVKAKIGGWWANEYGRIVQILDPQLAPVREMLGPVEAHLPLGG